MRLTYLASEAIAANLSIGECVTARLPCALSSARLVLPPLRLPPLCLVPLPWAALLLPPPLLVPLLPPPLSWESPPLVNRRAAAVVETIGGPLSELAQSARELGFVEVLLGGGGGGRA